ncbi:hypothetical protein FQR65_LT19027 [Abscondita terminalis]|nr:hypothetical protein FQR65_LT19027 [Abscondita terminalis]
MPVVVARCTLASSRRPQAGAAGAWAAAAAKGPHLVGSGMVGAGDERLIVYQLQAQALHLQVPSLPARQPPGAAVALQGLALHIPPRNLWAAKRVRPLRSSPWAAAAAAMISSAAPAGVVRLATSEKSSCGHGGPLAAIHSRPDCNGGVPLQVISDHLDQPRGGGGFPGGFFPKKSAV